MRTNSLQKMVASGLLIAIGIIIPMFSPIRIVLDPASFTLASHVAVFIAMMISPATAAAVAVGTTLGFFLGGFPITIVLRAASHLVFALVGSLFLQKRPQVLISGVKVHLFSFLIGILHGACEVVAVSPFYLSGTIGEAYYSQGYLYSVVLLVGVGSLVHSMIDFEISYAVMRVLSRQRGMITLFPRTRTNP